MNFGTVVMALTLAGIGVSPGLAQVSSPAGLQLAVEGLSRPAAIYVAGEGTPEPWGAAAGIAYPDTGGPITVDTPLRIASNTKTFTAEALGDGSD